MDFPGISESLSPPLPCHQTCSIARAIASPTYWRFAFSDCSFSFFMCSESFIVSDCCISALFSNLPTVPWLSLSCFAVAVFVRRCCFESARLDLLLVFFSTLPSRTGPSSVPLPRFFSFRLFYLCRFASNVCKLCFPIMPEPPNTKHQTPAVGSTVCMLYHCRSVRGR